MKLCLTVGKVSKTVVSEMILGHNIEMCITTADGLLSDRLRNPKFLGPPHPVTGIAPHWQGESCGRACYELVPGSGLMGSEAQLVRNVPPYGLYHLHQNKISVRAGEKLECEIWARAWREPTSLKVTLLPLAGRSLEYDSGEVLIDTPYFKRYVVPLRAKCDDDEARLRLTVADGGEIWFDQVHLRPKGEPHLSKKLIEEMAKMRIPALRFPGGIIANAYNWRCGTGPVHLRHLRYDPAFHQDWYLNYDFGLDEFLQLCVDQNIVPTLTFNVATGTPEEAVEMAAYCAKWYEKRGIPKPLIHWHVANHPYHQTTAHMSPDMYAEVIKAFVPGVKAVYPNSRIIAVMSCVLLDAEPKDAPWREALFAKAADLIDVVEVQKYGHCDSKAPDEKQVETLLYNLGTAALQMRSFIKLCRSRGVKWNLGVAEWNWWTHASHWDGRAFEETPSALHCLFIAGMIRCYAMLAPDFEVAHFYNLVNCMGILNRRNADVEVTDAVHVFNLYRPAFPGKLLSNKLTGLPKKNAMVESLALENDKGRWLFVTNYSHNKSAKLTVKGFSGNNAKVKGFRGSSLGGSLKKISGRFNGKTLEVPPMSILRVSC